MFSLTSKLFEAVNGNSCKNEACIALANDLFVFLPFDKMPIEVMAIPVVNCDFSYIHRDTLS